MRIIFLCLLFFGTSLVKAQPKTLSFDHLTAEQGLPDNNVLGLLQDTRGYMWIATSTGIARYNGYSVRDYKEKFLQNNITALRGGNIPLFMDRKGVVWFGSGRNGFLIRYNAQTDDFTEYRSRRTKDGTSRSPILNIIEDSEGDIWFLANSFSEKKNIVEQFNRKNEKFEDFVTGDKNRMPAGSISSLFSDKAGTVWLATENGIYHYDRVSKKFTGHLISADTSLKRNFWDFYEPPSEPGMLYMRYGENKKALGFVCYDVQKNTETHYYHKASGPNTLLNDSVLTFFEDRQKKLWIGTQMGLTYFDRDTKDFQNFIPADGQPENSANSFRIIRQSIDSGLWLSGGIPWSRRGKGLCYFDTEKKVFYRYLQDSKKADGLASNGISDIYTDQVGNMWIGYGGEGVQRINRARARFPAITNDTEKSFGYPGGRTYNIAETKAGLYWLATSIGLIRYDINSGFTRIKLFDDPLATNAPSSYVLVDKDDIIWYGHPNKGLFRYDPATGSIKNFLFNKDDSTSISSNNINCLYQDSRSIIWVGTSGGGICRYNKINENFTRFPYIINFSSNYKGSALNAISASSIYEDLKGRLWISAGGLNLMNRENGTFHLSKGISDVTGIQDADSGRLWISTAVSGLSLYDPDKDTTLRVYNARNGLITDGITGLSTDRRGNLWISTARGLSSLNTKTFVITNYTTAHGLPDNNLLSPPNLNSKGEMLVGYKDGVFVFSPDELKPSQILSVINLESVSYIDVIHSNDTPDTIMINGQQNIQLNYDQNRLTFRYTAIQYESSLLNRYKYKLEGYDKDWVMGGGSRSAIYTNLSPGTYTFYVKAANMDGVWNETPASVVIVIHPPWWRTWWAYLLYAILFGMLVWAFITWRARKLTRENRILEEKISHRTSQLQRSLEDLKSTQSQLIQSEKMASLGELTAGIAHEIQNPLNFVNNFSEVNSELITEMKEELTKGNIEEAKTIADDINDNEQKIIFHGKRADAIVKGMLQHSRSSNGVKEPTDINALADEYLRLAYHGLRAKDKSFNATMKTDFDESISTINIIPQDIGRVILNLITNAFYVVDEKKKQIGGDYEPTVSVSTRKNNGRVEISVKDNGNGIPQKVLDKIFQPFFTTKPAGQGTGLGLSLSYDIVKAHGGELKVETKEGEGSVFMIQLPGS